MKLLLMAGAGWIAFSLGWFVYAKRKINRAGERERIELMWHWFGDE